MRLGGNLQRPVTVGGLVDFVSPALKQLREQLSGGFLVVDDQNAGFRHGGVWLPRGEEGEREASAPCWGGRERELARRFRDEAAHGVEVRKRLLPVPETALGAQLQLHEGAAHFQLDRHAATVASVLDARQ